MTVDFIAGAFTGAIFVLFMLSIIASLSSKDD